MEKFIVSRIIPSVGSGSAMVERICFEGGNENPEQRAGVTRDAS